MTIFSPVSARLSRRHGPRVTLLFGTAVLAVGNAGLATLPDSIPMIMIASTVTAIGAALSYSAVPLIIMAAVPDTETAAANSLNTLMRMLGTSSCSAVFAAVATGLVSTVGGHTVPAGAAFVAVFLAAAGSALVAFGITAVHRGGAERSAAGPAGAPGSVSLRC